MIALLLVFGAIGLAVGAPSTPDQRVVADSVAAPPNVDPVAPPTSVFVEPTTVPVPTPTTAAPTSSTSPTTARPAVRPVVGPQQVAPVAPTTATVATRTPAPYPVLSDCTLEGILWPTPGAPTFYYTLRVPSMAGHHVYGAIEFSSAAGALTNFGTELDASGSSALIATAPASTSQGDSVTLHANVAMGTVPAGAPSRSLCPDIVLTPAWA